MTATQQCEKVCHPIVVVNVNGVMNRALLNTEAYSQERAQSRHECGPSWEK